MAKLIQRLSITAVAFGCLGLQSVSSFSSEDQPDTNQLREDSRSSQGITEDTDKRRIEAERSKRNNKRRKGNKRYDREVRTYDGSGNNLENIEWGATFIHLQRFAPSDYEDEISALAGELRPSAREVSNAIVNQEPEESILNTYGTSDFMWQWGQFLDHDIDLTDGNQETANIAVPLGDPHFDPTGTGVQIIPFSRAIFDSSTGTDITNPREQENEITSWIDGSNVYGSDEERAMALRVGPDSPFLKVSKGNLLPFNTDNLTNANGFVADPTTLFLAGDVRANEQVGLAAMHTLFVREHNRVARILKHSMKGASGEEIFQAARRVVIAELQIITYDEFLPALIGPNAIAPYSGYDSSIDPSIFNEFSAAAYRLGHSMLSGQILRLNKRGQEITDGHIDLKEAFFTAPSILNSNNDLAPIFRGLASQAHQQIDIKVVDALRNFLFGNPGQGGLDLPSLNIQRGRDHGLSSYNDTREAMGLTRITEFSEITADAELAQALQDTYGSVDDIDLWIGGLAETPLAEQDSQLGELFTTMLSRQFTALRDGDRFWHTRDLNKLEKRLVKGITLSKVIKNNTRIGRELQANVFYIPE
ncbi:peroxiredoxin [Alteromonadaceae bacterium M269]|nr:peroxiredoxin [Alteromonadaceae bacterium M269]